MHSTSRILIRYINLDRSEKRDQIFRSSFSSYNLKRIKAIDGISFSDNTVNENSLYNWDLNIKKDFLDYGFLINNGYYDLSPNEFACGLSHRLAVLDFLRSGEEYGFIFEDDTQPLVDLNKFIMPSNVDFYCLLGTDHPGMRVACYKDQIKMLRNMSAYVLNRNAAVAFLKSTMPLFCIQDTQFSILSFSAVDVRGTGRPLEKVVNLSTYAPKESLVELNEEAKNTTFTYNGKKEWMPKGWI